MISTPGQIANRSPGSQAQLCKGHTATNDLATSPRKVWFTKASVCVATTYDTLHWGTLSHSAHSTSRPLSKNSAAYTNFPPKGIKVNPACRVNISGRAYPFFG